MLQITERDLQKRKCIVKKITNILKPYYPECIVEMFGSSVNGFGCKGCDLDLLFLPFPQYCNLVSVFFLIKCSKFLAFNLF